MNEREERHIMASLPGGRWTCTCGDVASSTDQRDLFIHEVWAVRQERDAALDALDEAERERDQARDLLTEHEGVSVRQQVSNQKQQQLLERVAARLEQATALLRAMYDAFYGYVHDARSEKALHEAGAFLASPLSSERETLDSRGSIASDGTTEEAQHE